MESHSNSPFNFDNDKAYQFWRNVKLTNAKTRDNVSIINIKKTPPHFLALFSENKTDTQYSDIFPVDEILTECKYNNYCIYKLEDKNYLDSKTTKQLIHKLAQSCGISKLDNNICADEDSLTSIYNKKTNDKREYIPYTNKKLSWHTDGYYNSRNKTIYSMLLHCYEDADTGGESSFIDHEIIYILLRDKNPNWIKALSNQNTMTIPANILNDEEIRAEQSGPVFSISPTGRLHMRYSARTKNISWREDKDTQAAMSYIKELLDDNSASASTKFVVKHKLKAGEGIITRNVLHSREAFKDHDTASKQRLLFRGRFYDELPESTKVK